MTNQEHQETIVFGMTHIQQYSLDTPTVCLVRNIICNIFYENQFLSRSVMKAVIDTNYIIFAGYHDLRSNKTAN